MSMDRRLLTRLVRLLVAGRNVLVLSPDLSVPFQPNPLTNGLF